MALSRTPTAPLFGEGTAGTLQLIIYLLVGIALMAADRHSHYLQRIRATSALAVEPLYRAAALPSDAARAVSMAIADRKALTAENAELKQALLLAQARLTRLGAVSEQN